MSEDDSGPEAVEEALDRAMDAFGPPDDPADLEPNYPSDSTPEDRVVHVLFNEYPRWRDLEWIAAAADTDLDPCRSVIQERLAAGELELSERGIRRNRYHVYFEEVDRAAEKARDPPY